jgi:hypothetical protein
MDHQEGRPVTDIRAPIPRLAPHAPEERAVRWLIATPGATYAEAARKFQVTFNSVRARVEYRYGSLMIARETAEIDPDITREHRRCIVCREPQNMDRYQYICPSCRRGVDGKHGGHV